MKSSIFFSYHTNDIEYATSLALALEDKSFTVWVKDLHGVVGKPLDRQEESAIEASEFILFMLSQSSVSSTKLIEAAQAFLDSSKTFIPLLIEACELPMILKRIQFIDLHTDKSKGISDLLKALAIKGQNYDEMHHDVIALLTEREKELISKKEHARLRYEKRARQSRNRRTFFKGIVGIIVGIIAFTTWTYVKKDIDDFRRIERDFNLYNNHSADSISIITSEFKEHLFNFPLCNHKVLIDEYTGYNSNNKYIDNSLEHLKEIDSLKAVIDSLTHDR